MIVSVVLSSCVDDEVAPEVSALRQAQVDMLNSKTAMQDLLNAAQEIENSFEAAMNALLLDAKETANAQAEMALTHQEALNALEILRRTDQDAYQAAINALNLQDREADLAYNGAIRALSLLRQTQQDSYEAAMDSINIARAEIQLEEDLAWFEVESKQIEWQLVQAELELEKALADMAKYVATSGLDEAGEYLDEYGWAMDDYYMLAQQVVGKQTDIAQMELTLGEDPDITGQFEEFAKMVQEQIDEQTMELTAKLALLEDLKAVAADPTAAETALAAAKVKIQSLQNDNAQLNVDREKHLQDVLNVAQEELDEAYNTINTYDWAKNDIEYREQEIEDREQWIENNESSNESDNVWIARYEAELVNREAILATNTAEYEKQEALLEEAGAIRNEAEEAMALADNNLQLANIANRALWNDFDEADRKRWDAQVAFWDADGEFWRAEHELADATDDYDANYESAVADLEAYETAEETALTALAAAQADFDADPTNANLAALENARWDYSNAQSMTASQQDRVDGLSDRLSDAETALPLAKAKLDMATTNLAVAEAERDAAEQAALEDESTEVQAAWRAYDAARADYYTARDAYNKQNDITWWAQNLMDNAQYEVDWRKQDIETLNGIIEKRNGWIAADEEAIAVAMLDIENFEAVVSELQTAYDALTVEALYALREAVDEAWEANDDFDKQIDANLQMIYAQNRLIWVLEDQLNSINAEIEAVENDIEWLSGSIAEKEAALIKNADDMDAEVAQYTIDKDKAVALLEIAKEELALLETKRDAALEAANKWMGLYEAAIAE